MKYLGGKHGIGKLIAEFLKKQCPPDEMNGYLEPFCGSLGVFKNITNMGYKKCIASDIQPDLIELWKQLQKNSLKLPNSISEKEYNNLKNAKSPNALKAVAGFGLSFGGKYFAGYAQKWAGNSGRNFLQEFKTSMHKIQPLIEGKDVIFLNKSYTEFKPNNMLIYCDPPYKDTQGYSTGEFDHDAFWETMRNWSKNNCVFISEESAPKDFKVVWKRKKRRTLDKQNRFHSYEKIYKYSGFEKHEKTRKNKNNKNKTKKNKKLFN
jgi:DNA adenine methylase